jgi:lipopolysaccharide/colanic/teichoic acid biosynthesis glycosyltransferase
MSLTSHDRRPQPHSRRLVKPLVDGLVATLLLLLAAPWLALIALALWLTDDGPVLHRDQRAGLGGRPFSLLRFRTTAWGSAGSAAAAPRAVHRLLQRTHLDELPQLFNVVRGDLSLVGPRPRPCDGGEEGTAVQVKPGLIGLSDPAAAWPEDQPLTAQRYAEEWSLRLDLAILWRALRHASRGADAR